MKLENVKVSDTTPMGSHTPNHTVSLVRRLCQIQPLVVSHTHTHIVLLVRRSVWWNPLWIIILIQDLQSAALSDATPCGFSYSHPHSIYRKEALSDATPCGFSCSHPHSASSQQLCQVEPLKVSHAPTHSVLLVSCSVRWNPLRCIMLPPTQCF